MTTHELQGEVHKYQVARDKNDREIYIVQRR